MPSPSHRPRRRPRRRRCRRARPRPRAPICSAATSRELAAILAELLSQGLQLASQLEQLQTQVRYTEQTLRQLDPTSFSGLVNTFNTLRWNYQSLAGQVQTISFTANHVQSDFNRLFPKDKNAWRGVRSSDFDGYYTGWQTRDQQLVARRHERADADRSARSGRTT